jgi:hypothetical protein
MLATPWLTTGWLRRNYDDGRVGEAEQRGMFSFCVPRRGKFMWSENYLQNITKPRAPYRHIRLLTQPYSVTSFLSPLCFELSCFIYLLKPKPQPVVNTSLVSPNEFISCTPKWPTKPDVLRVCVFYICPDNWLYQPDDDLLDLFAKDLRVYWMQLKQALQNKTRWKYDKLHGQWRKYTVREFRKKISLTTKFHLKTIKNSSTAVATSYAISVLTGKKLQPNSDVC